MIYVYVREAIEYTFEYSKISKEFVDTIDLSQDEDPKKQIVEQLLVPLYGLDSSDIFNKPHSNEVEINSKNTAKLIADIKD